MRKGFRNQRCWRRLVFALIALSFVLPTALSGASTPPQINIGATTLPTMGNVGQSFYISVPISDDTGVVKAEILYKPIGASDFVEINMTLSGGDTLSGTWDATIPAQDTGGILEFHIFALDNEGLSSRYPVSDEQEIFIGSMGTVPEVLYTSPKDGDIIDPGTRDSIKIGFNTEMNRTSVEGALSISPSINTEKFIWSVNGTEVTIPFSSAIVPGANYTVILSSSARAADGTPMSSSYSFKFYALEDFSNPTIGWDPMMVSIASIGVLLLIALLLFRGLVNRNSSGKKENDKENDEEKDEE